MRQVPKPNRLTRAFRALFNISPNDIHEIDHDIIADPVSMQFLLGRGKRSARQREDIYADWQFMLGDPIISTALRLHVTSALGGHETSGDLVFIEVDPKFAKDAAKKKLVEEISADLSPLFNEAAFPVAFNGAAYGDSYARVYSAPNVGVTGMLTDEMVLPPLVQPYQKGDKTVGFVVSTGGRYQERLNVTQMARMRMPRLLYTPQQRIIDKAIRTALHIDDIDELPVLPALVGGSFLQSAEEPYWNLASALNGLVGMRVLDSIDETLLGVNLDGATADQQETFMNSLATLLKRSKEYAEKAAQEGKPVLGRIRHLIPMFQEKQLVNIMGSNGGASGGKATSYTVEDVLFHAKLLSGSLGIDLSMLGFADQLSGGLGEGGFFRMSAQAAERSRILRVALTAFFDHVINIHLIQKKNISFAPNEKPWRVNYYGAISALERERQDTRMNAMNTGQILVGTLVQMKELGQDESALTHILQHEMKLDEAAAKLLASMVVKAAKIDPNSAMGGGFGDPGGGFGGGNDGGGGAPPFGGGAEDEQ
jgi:hypothetical protein